MKSENHQRQFTSLSMASTESVQQTHTQSKRASSTSSSNAESSLAQNNVVWTNMEHSGDDDSENNRSEGRHNHVHWQFQQPSNDTLMSSSQEMDSIFQSKRIVCKSENASAYHESCDVDVVFTWINASESGWCHQVHRHHADADDNFHTYPLHPHLHLKSSTAAFVIGRAAILHALCSAFRTLGSTHLYRFGFACATTLLVEQRSSTNSNNLSL